MLPSLMFAQRYLLEFSNEDSQKMLEKAEKAYNAGRYSRSVDLYSSLIEKEGLSPELAYNQLTSAIFLQDTILIDRAFTQLQQSDFKDCQ